MSNKEWFIYCNEFNSPSAALLAKRLGIGFGSNPKKSRCKIIRWGSSKDFPRKLLLEFPSQDSIAICANKLKSLNILKDNGILVPKIYVTKENLKNISFPLYSRKEYHTMGKDIILIHDINEAISSLKNERYLVESIECKKEYRIHIFLGKMIFGSKKYFRKQLWEELGKPKMKDLIRNNSHGWGYHYFNDVNNIPESVIKEAEKAVKALGLIWGAVDIIKSKNNKPYILEINSAPGLREDGADLYAEEFQKLIDNPTIVGE